MIVHATFKKQGQILILMNHEIIVLVCQHIDVWMKINKIF